MLTPLSDAPATRPATPKRKRGACKFKQCDVTRAVRAVTKAGMEIARVEIAPDGNIIISTNAAPATPTNDLDRELAEFEARK
jgi:hypothetical protein